MIELEKKSYFKDIIPQGRVLRFYPGTLIRDPQDQEPWFGIVTQGGLDITRFSPNGRKIILGTINAGETVGETSIFPHDPQGYTNGSSLVSRGESTLLCYTAGQYCSFLMEYPHFRMWILQTVATRLRNNEQRATESQFMFVPQRLAIALLELAQSGEKNKGSITLNHGLTQVQLASLIGSARETVSNALREMQQQGIVATGYRKMTIYNPNALHQIAGIKP